MKLLNEYCVLRHMENVNLATDANLLIFDLLSIK